MKQRDLAASLDSLRARLHEAREELTRADAKISTIFAAEGVVAGVLLAAMVAGDWSPKSLSLCLGLVWWTGAVLWLASLATLGFGLYPRTKRKGPPVPGIAAYFGDKTPAADRTSAQTMSSSLERLRLEVQVAQVSWIARRKYAAIRVSWWCVGAGSLLLLIAALFVA